MIILFGLSLFLSLNTFADTEIECMEKIAQFTGVGLGNAKVYKGQNVDGQCEVDLEYKKHNLGSADEEEREYFIGVNVESPYDRNTLVEGVWTTLTYNNPLDKQKIKDCFIKDNTLNIIIKRKSLVGWRKKTSYKVSMEKKGSSLNITSEKRKRGTKFKSSCTIDTADTALN